MVPPGVSRQGPGKAAVLDRIALQALAQKGEGPGRAAEAQTAQGPRPPLGGCAADRQLLLELLPEIDAAAAMLQPLQTQQRFSMRVVAAPQIALCRHQRESVEPFAADQPLPAAEVILLKQQIPAHVVKDELQRPHAQLAAWTFGMAAGPWETAQQHAATRHDRPLDGLGAPRRRQ